MMHHNLDLTKILNTTRKLSQDHGAAISADPVRVSACTCGRTFPTTPEGWRRFYDHPNEEIIDAILPELSRQLGLKLDRGLRITDWDKAMSAGAIEELENLRSRAVGIVRGTVFVALSNSQQPQAPLAPTFEDWTEVIDDANRHHPALVSLTLAAARAGLPVLEIVIEPTDRPVLHWNLPQGRVIVRQDPTGGDWFEVEPIPRGGEQPRLALDVNAAVEIATSHLRQEQFV